MMRWHHIALLLVVVAAAGPTPVSSQAIGGGSASAQAAEVAARAAEQREDYASARDILLAATAACEKRGEPCELLWNMLGHNARRLGDDGLATVADERWRAISDREVRDTAERAARGEFGKGDAQAEGLEALGRYAEAEPIRRALLAEAVAAHGTPSMRAGFAMASLGEAVARQSGRFDEGIAIRARAIAMFLQLKRTGDSNPQEVAAVFCASTAAMLEGRGRYAEAERWRRLGYTLRSGQDELSVVTNIALNDLIRNLLKQRKFAAAVPPLDHLIRLLKARAVENSPRLIQPHMLLALAKDWTGDPAGARLNYRRAVAIGQLAEAAPDDRYRMKLRQEYRPALLRNISINWQLANQP